MTDASFVNSPDSCFPKKKESTAMRTPTAKESPIPICSVFSARSLLPAPIFCATNADRDCMKADGTSMMKPTIFSATPTPAEGITPRVFTIAWMTRKEMPTSRSCRAMGMPRKQTRLIRGMSGRIISFENENGSVFFRIIRKDMITLIACAATVA